MRLFRLCSYVAACLALFGISCIHDTTGPTLRNLSGDWSKVVTSHLRSCSPSALPAPSTSEPAQYVQLPAPIATDSFRIHIRQSGTSIQIALADSGHRDQIPSTLRGTIDETFRISSTSASGPPRLEGIRAGGHQFTVTESAIDTSMFRPSISTQDGTVTGLTFLSIGSRLFAFHDGGPDGIVFTTCVVADTGRGGTIE